MTEEDRRQRIRLERRLQRLGGLQPVCIRCGCREVEALTGVPYALLPPELQRRLIEWHHPAGRKVDPTFKVPLCRNCHAIMTEEQRGYPPELRRPKTEEEFLVSRIWGAAQVILWASRSLEDAHSRLANDLNEFFDQLQDPKARVATFVVLLFLFLLMALPRQSGEMTP